jgi:4-hydroxy-L-threonine phosphate dehydrogenase PdxA
MGLDGHFDAIVSMYHDQGQIALKSAAFEGACTIYLGLHFVRLSVPHGTAMDIAGQGRAQHLSMLAAMKTAALLAAGGGFLKELR